MEDNTREVVMIGVGGAGCQIVGRLDAAGEDGLVTMAIDSDACALAESAAVSRIQIGDELLSGFGTGGDAENGRRAMESGTGDVLAALEGPRMAIIVAGLGGGVGGSVTVLAHELAAAGILVLCFVVTPFAFEGRQRVSAAARALKALTETDAAVVEVPADSLMSRASDAMPEIFNKAAGILTGAVLAVYHTVVSPGYIRIGFPEIRRVAADTDGACRFAFVDAAGEGRAERVIDGLKTSPMLDNGELLAKGRLLLVAIVGGPDMTLQETGAVLTMVDESVRPECRVSSGTALCDSWTGRLSAIVIVGGKRKVTSSVEPPAPASEPDGKVVKARAAPGVKPSRRGRTRQARLPLEVSGRGRFKDVEPTILNGEDLDVPTFIRRGIKIDR